MKHMTQAEFAALDEDARACMLVLVIRGEVWLLPDHLAIADGRRALEAMAEEIRTGTYRSKPLTDAQRACLEGQ